MLQVTWCRKKMRASDPHRKAVTPPQRVRVIASPMRPGSKNVTSVMSGKFLWTFTRSSSFNRSGAQRSRSVRSGVTNHPTCACHRPRTTPAKPSPSSRWGECGSPSLSEKAWWRRCAATQSMSEPCSAIEPAIASAIFSGRTASKLLCVNNRWYPTVTPSPVIA